MRNSYELLLFWKLRGGTAAVHPKFGFESIASKHCLVNSLNSLADRRVQSVPENALYLPVFIHLSHLDNTGAPALSPLSIQII